MATEVSICANALRRLGDDPITSLTDDTERARLCNAFYEDARDACLRSHPWNFAITRASLNILKLLFPSHDRGGALRVALTMSNVAATAAAGDVSVIVTYVVD